MGTLKSVLSNRGLAIKARKCLRGSLTFKLVVLVFFIVFDTDRGHCYEHLKKNQFTMKIERVTCICMFVYAMNFALPEMAKSEVLDFSGPTCLS